MSISWNRYRNRHHVLCSYRSGPAGCWAACTGNAEITGTGDSCHPHSASSRFLSTADEGRAEAKDHIVLAASPQPYGVQQPVLRQLAPRGAGLG